MEASTNFGDCSVNHGLVSLVERTTSFNSPRLSWLSIVEQAARVRESVSPHLAGNQY